MQSDGFDAVIGNPPWISLSGKFGKSIYLKSDIEYLINKYNGNAYMPNIYEYFVSKGLTLTRQNGYFSFIVPDRLGFNDQFVFLRNRILTESKIISLVYKAPFPGITADTLIFSLQKQKPNKNHEVQTMRYGRSIIKRLQYEFYDSPNCKFEYFDNIETMKLLDKLILSKKTIELNQICSSTSGFGGKSSLIQEIRTSPSQIVTLKGDSISRYCVKKKYWFDFKKENITGRTTDRNKLGASKKILVRKTGSQLIAAYEDSGIFPEQSLSVFI